MSGQENFPEELNEMETNNLSDAGFKSNNYKDAQQHEKRHRKKDQSGIKNAISDINNTLEGINSKLDEAQDRIRNLEDKVEKTPKQSSKKEIF